LLKDLRARLLNLVPLGTSGILWGLVVNGLTTYGYLVVARVALGDEGYGGLAVLWALVNIGGFGLFQPLEQEVARATADRASRGLGSAPVLRRAGVLGAVQFMLVTVGLLVAWPLGLDGLLDDRPELLVALVLALGAFAGTQLVRGILGGRHLFGRYAWYFTVEGGARMAVAVALALAGVAAVGAYGLAIALALVVAAVVAAGPRPFVRPGPPASYRELTPAMGFLLIASIGEAFILNVGPVAVDIAGGDELGPEAPGVFLNGMLIARIPLFFFQAVKASLLPSLATLAGHGDLVGFRNMQIKIVTAVGAAAAATIVVAAAVGPLVVRVVFGDELGRMDMALLAASGGGLMLMLSLTLGLVALGHTRLAVAGWVAGIAAFAATVSFDLEPFLRVEWALVAAVLAGSLVAGGLLRVEYAAHRREA
jgi:O-antigen/teichoic acid export membrane protein